MQNFYAQGTEFTHSGVDAAIGMSAVEKANFYGKVIFCFGIALLVSASGVYTSFQYLIPSMLANRGLIGIAYALELILVFSARFWSTRKPLNYFIFAFFAFLTGVTISPLITGVILEFGGPMLLVKALLATTAAFAAAAVFSSVTKRSLLGIGGFLTVSLIGMIIVSVIGVFFPWSNMFEMIFAGFGTIIFIGYTIYDFQKLKSYPPDQYIDAALQIYLDIFNLFLYILRLMGGLSRR